MMKGAAPLAASRSRTSSTLSRTYLRSSTTVLPKGAYPRPGAAHVSLPPSAAEASLYHALPRRSSLVERTCSCVGFGRGRGAFRPLIALIVADQSCDGTDA